MKQPESRHLRFRTINRLSTIFNFFIELNKKSLKNDAFDALDLHFKP